jgi:hypothetical protein
MAIRKKTNGFLGLGPLAWLYAWGFYAWASNQIHPQHGDVGHVLARARHFWDKLNAAMS